MIPKLIGSETDDIWAALREKVPNVLSRCHTKLFEKKILKSRCHTKRRVGAAPCAHPSFGMTATQDIRDLFAKGSPFTLE